MLFSSFACCPKRFTLKSNSSVTRIITSVIQHRQHVCVLFSSLTNFFSTNNWLLYLLTMLNKDSQECQKHLIADYIWVFFITYKRTSNNQKLWKHQNQTFEQNMRQCTEKIFILKTCEIVSFNIWEWQWRQAKPCYLKKTSWVVSWDFCTQIDNFLSLYLTNFEAI